MAWSEEVQGLVGVVDRSGLSHNVTSVCRTGDPNTSYHNREGTNGCGLAVDFAGPVPFSQRVPHKPLLDIFNALAEHSEQLAELFYSGAPFFVKNGVRHDIFLLSPAVRNAHWNHVHAAVTRGTILAQDDIVAGQVSGTGTLIVVSDTIQTQSPVANLVPTPTGKGYWIVTVRGEIFAFGDAGFFGRVEYQGAL